MTSGKARLINPTIALKDLLIASAPEQKLPLEGIFNQYGLEVFVLEDSRNAQLAANPGRIKFGHKTMAVYWMLGFAGWCVIECYVPALYASLCGLGSLRECLGMDAGLVEVGDKFRERRPSHRRFLSKTRQAFPDLGR